MGDEIEREALMSPFALPSWGAITAENYKNKKINKNKILITKKKMVNSMGFYEESGVVNLIIYFGGDLPVNLTNPPLPPPSPLT